jgi:hypothetical protein
MSPNAIRRNVDRVTRLRQHALDADIAGQVALARQIAADADRVARPTAEAIRLSDHWPETTKESLLHALERL